MGLSRIQTAVILADLLDRMHAHGSWCGETHLQKATYFMQQLTEVPTKFQFILYKHGPFSFDLRDELSSLRADGILGLAIRPEPYAPGYATTERVTQLKSRYVRTLAKCGDAVERIAHFVRDRGAAELERLATALFITRMEPYRDGASVDVRAKRLHELKPHVPIGSAKAAVVEMDGFLEKVSASR